MSAEPHAPSEKRAASNAALLLATNASRIVFNAAFFLVVARLLGAEELGRFSFALSYATLFAVAVHLGLNDLIIRQVAIRKEEGPKYFTLALAIKSVAGVVITGVTAVAIALSGKPVAVQHMVWAAALTTTLITGLETIVVAFFYAHERMSYILALSALKSALNAGVGIGVALAGRGAQGILWGMLGVETVCAGLAFIWVRTRLGVGLTAVRWKETPTLLWRSLPFALNGIFITVYQQLHYSLLSFYKGDAATGLYAAAAKLVTFLNFIPSALTQALYPYLSRVAAAAGGDPRPATLRWVRYLAVISFPAALYVWGRAAPVIAIAYGGGYADAARVLTVLALALPFTFATYPYAIALNAIHKERANTAVAAGAAAVNVVCNLIFIPLWGPVGAAWAWFATETSQSVARQILVWRWMGPLGNPLNVFRLVVPVAAMGGLMYLLRGWPVYAELPTLAVLYVGAAFATGALKREDVATWFGRGKRPGG